MVEIFSILEVVWNIYDNLGFLSKVWKSFGLTKDYFILKWKNPEVFISLEKIYFVEKSKKDCLELIEDKVLTNLKTENGIEAKNDGISFEMSNSHLGFSISEKEIDTPGNKHKIVVLKTETRLYYPFREKSIIRRLQSDFYSISEIISSCYNFNKSNEIIKLKLNIENNDNKTQYSYNIEDSEVIYQNKEIQINTKHGKDSYSLILASILLWHLKFKESKFVKTINHLE